MQEVIDRYLPDWVALRRHLHQHPETGFKEIETQKLLKEKLMSWGIEEQDIKVCAKTGLVVDIRGSLRQEGSEKSPYSGPSMIALRTDIDALAMDEANIDLPYRSVKSGRKRFDISSFSLSFADPRAPKSQGVAHMCGHDGHMAMLMGAAQILAERRDRIPINRTVRLLIQPAEEGPGGAPVMIEEGCLDGVEEVYGLHNWPMIPVGQLRVKAGPLMAHVSEFEVVIHGKGGHASQPQDSIDPIIATCHIVTSLQTIMSRNIHYMENAVLSITYVRGGTVNNVIPSSCVFGGTIRDLDSKVCDTITSRFQSLVGNLAEGFGCKAEIHLESFYPVLVNSERETETVIRAASKVVGREKISSEGLPMLGAEDFAYYLEKKPGCFFFVGGGEESRENHICHSDHFDFNDKTLPFGVKVWLSLVEDRFAMSLF